MEPAFKLFQAFPFLLRCNPGPDSGPELQSLNFSFLTRFLLAPALKAAGVQLHWDST